jgi:hypothetical protein
MYLPETAEEWKAIPFLTDHEASNLGRIRNAKTGVIRKSHATQKYYFRLSIQRKTYYVHRLVMAAWAGRELMPREFVRHLDDDGLNNKIENLAIGNHASNWQDRRDNDRAGLKLRLRDVQRIRADLKRRESKMIAAQYGISHSHVRNIKSGHRYGWLS